MKYSFIFYEKFGKKIFGNFSNFSNFNISKFSFGIELFVLSMSYGFEVVKCGGFCSKGFLNFVGLFS